MTLPPDPATAPPPRPTSPLTLLNPDGTLRSSEQVQSEINERIRDTQRRAEQMRMELASTTAEGVSSNQAATVTVAPGGGLQSIRLNDRVKSMPPAMIAGSIMDAYGRASRSAAEKSIEIAERHGDARVADMMRDILPPPPAEDDGRVR